MRLVAFVSALTLGLVATPAHAQGPTATSPLAIHVGDADFLIGGFVDAAAVIRSTTVGSGIGTAFDAIPFSNSSDGQLSETRLTAQSSRLSLLATSTLGPAAIAGYVEADFLGSAPSNVFVSSTSSPLRIRLAWVQFVKGKFEFLGGQSWSLLTPNRTGLSPKPGDVFITQNMDLNFQAGLTWARQAQFRLIAHATKTIAAGVSVENPQQFIGPAVVLPAAFPHDELDNGSNAGTPNPYPDIIGKIAFDPMTGSLHQHVEFAGLVRGFKTYNPATSTSYNATGSAMSVNVNFEPVKKLHLIGTSFFSNGGGRYIFGLGPDLIVDADGHPELVNAKAGIGGAELAISRTQLFGYSSVATFDQVTAADVGGQPIGYGLTGATGANRKIAETTFGLNHPIFDDPGHGALRLIVQYSLVTRTPWSVPAGTPERAKMHMVYFTVRYVLP
jgi:hypothetical protein